MTNADEFVRWVSDPARTNDELFTVELILEQLRGHGWPFTYVDSSFEGHRERARERKLNPGHRPAFHLDELAAVAARAETLISFGGAYGDRPLRDLAALRFFPALQNVNLQGSDVADLRPLATLRKVQYLSITEDGDLYGCRQLCLAEAGEMPELQRLHLALTHPWCDLRGLANWPALAEITFSGNLLALEEVPRVPAAVAVALNNWVSAKLDLRDLHRLPEMPKARRLTVAATASLEGIERYPTVVNLDLGGCFRDLGPLAAMENITALTLRGERFEDLTPLARMPRLREITFVREWPLDLSALTECPQLRRVDYKNCAMMRTEVAALNAGLLPEALDFKAAQPRPLRPLRCYELPKDETDGRDFFQNRSAKLHAEREAFYDGDLAFQQAEKRAFVHAMQAKFDQLLGRGWGIFELPFTSIKRYQDTVRTLELVEAVREYSAQSRWPQEVSFIVEPHGDMSEALEQIRARHEQATAPDDDYLIRYYDDAAVLSENEEGRRQRVERYELLKREHLRRLLGENADDLLSVTPAGGAPSAEPEEEEDPEDEPPAPSDSGEDESGGVAVAPPPPPPPEGAESLSADLMFYLAVHEDCVVANAYWAERARYTLAVPFITWTPEEAKLLAVADLESR